jgi:hypothetical protein
MEAAMTETPMEALTRRLDHLERENRRFRRTAMALALGVAAVVLMGQAVAQGPTLETQKLVLKDGHGKVRAVLGEFSDEEPFGVLVLDAQQRIRAKLGVQEDGSPVLALADERGVDRVTLDRATGLRVQGDGPSLTLGVTYGNEPALHLNDRDGWTRAALILTGTSPAPILRLLDTRGNVRAWFGAMSDGKAQLLLMNRPQPVKPGEAIDLARPRRAADARLEVDADGTMGLRFFRDGTIWKAP